MELSIIIVNYKCKEKTINCIDKIYQSNLENINFEIILVDNNSDDKILDIVKDKYSQVIFIQTEKNLGMGGGNNVGIKIAKGDYVLILNPDTAPENTAIKKMLFDLKTDQSIGLIGPKLLYPDGKFQNSCFSFPTLLTPFYRRTFLGKIRSKSLDLFLMNKYNLNNKIEVDWLMGSCLLLKKETLEKVGMFDERYFMYFEDTDLCRKIKKNNLKVIYNPEAIVYHDHVRGSAKSSFIFLPFNKLARMHVISWVKYSWKWRKD